MARRHNTPARPGAARAYVPEQARAEPEQISPKLDANGQPLPPDGWVKGQLLNVRNAGGHYNVTLEGEEYDPRHPERSMQFTNPGELQNFVSAWYARESGGMFSS